MRSSSTVQVLQPYMDPNPNVWRSALRPEQNYVQTGTDVSSSGSRGCAREAFSTRPAVKPNRNAQVNTSRSGSERLRDYYYPLDYGQPIPPNKMRGGSVGSSSKERSYEPIDESVYKHPYEGSSHGTTTYISSDPSALGRRDSRDSSVFTNYSIPNPSVHRTHSASTFGSNVSGTGLSPQPEVSHTTPEKRSTRVAHDGTWRTESPSSTERFTQIRTRLGDRFLVEGEDSLVTDRSKSTVRVDPTTGQTVETNIHKIKTSGSRHETNLDLPKRLYANSSANSSRYSDMRGVVSATQNEKDDEEEVLIVTTVTKTTTTTTTVSEHENGEKEEVVDTKETIETLEEEFLMDEDGVSRPTGAPPARKVEVRPASSTGTNVRSQSSAQSRSSRSNDEEWFSNRLVPSGSRGHSAARSYSKSRSPSHHHQQQYPESIAYDSSALTSRNTSVQPSPSKTNSIDNSHSRHGAASHLSSHRLRDSLLYNFDTNSASGRSPSTQSTGRGSVGRQSTAPPHSPHEALQSDKNDIRRPLTNRSGRVEMIDRSAEYAALEAQCRRVREQVDTLERAHATRLRREALVNWEAEGSSKWVGNGENYAKDFQNAFSAKLSHANSIIDHKGSSPSTSSQRASSTAALSTPSADANLSVTPHEMRFESPRRAEHLEDELMASYLSEVPSVTAVSPMSPEHVSPRTSFSGGEHADAAHHGFQHPWVAPGTDGSNFVRSDSQVLRQHSDNDEEDVGPPKMEVLPPKAPQARDDNLVRTPSGQRSIASMSAATPTRSKGVSSSSLASPVRKSPPTPSHQRREHNLSPHDLHMLVCERCYKRHKPDEDLVALGEEVLHAVCGHSPYLQHNFAINSTPDGGLSSGKHSSHNTTPAIHENWNASTDPLDDMWRDGSLRVASRTPTPTGRSSSTGRSATPPRAHSSNVRAVAEEEPQPPSRSPSQRSQKRQSSYLSPTVASLAKCTTEGLLHHISLEPNPNPLPKGMFPLEVTPPREVKPEPLHFDLNSSQMSTYYSAVYKTEAGAPVAERSNLVTRRSSSKPLPLGMGSRRSSVSSIIATPSKAHHDGEGSAVDAEALSPSRIGLPEKHPLKQVVLVRDDV